MTSNSTVTLAVSEADKEIGRSSSARSTPTISADPYEVFLDEDEDPENMSKVRKWIVVIVISISSLCVTSTSSLALFTQAGVAQDFHVPHLVTVLSMSLFVEGLGLGPLLVGPLSEVYGRNPIYRTSYVLLFAFSFAVAFAPNIVVYLTFRFITGLCGAAFLSVAGGSVSDMFSDTTVASPMAVYTVSPFIGPVLGPLISGFINQNVHWRWTYYVQIIWIFIQCIAIFLFVPETYAPIIRKHKADRLRQSTKECRYWSPKDEEAKNLLSAIGVSCCRPFQLMFFDRMALLLNIWTAFILGILYMAFQAFPIIFREIRGFSMQNTGMTFLGIGFGMLLVLPLQPIWDRIVAREAESHGGKAPPEAHLIVGQVGGILVPIGLFGIAMTSNPNAHWILPILFSIPFGSGIILVYTSVFTYLVTAYRPIAASAMASNSALRSSFAAVFPLFSGKMYSNLGTVGATAILAGVMMVMTPLPFIFRRLGHSLRQKSRFATH